MKFRDGFVSNSSSSSYVIALKNAEPNSINQDIKIIAETIFPSSLKFPQYLFYRDLTMEIIRHLLYHARLQDLESYARYLKKECYYNEEETIQDNTVIKLLKEGWKVYTGRVSNEDSDTIDNLLYQFNIEHEDDNLIIEFGA